MLFSDRPRSQLSMFISYEIEQKNSSIFYNNLPEDLIYICFFGQISNFIRKINKNIISVVNTCVKDIL